MVRRFRWSACLLLFTLGAQAAELNIELAKTSVAYGEPVELVLTTDAADAPLTKIDLRPWLSAFHIAEPEVMADDNNQRQKMRLKLYPRSTGTLTLAPLTLGKLRTTTRKISVQQAQSITAPAPIEIRQEWSTSSVLQREAIRHRFNLESSDAFAELAANDVADDRLLITQSTSSRETLRQNGKTRYRYTIDRFYFPQVAGKQALRAALIEYQVNGQTRYRFASPVNMVQVKPLPQYLPPFLPVGTLHISSRIETGQAAWRPLKTHHLYYWHIRLEGSNLSPGTLPGVLSQLRSNADIAFLPAESRREQALKNGQWVEAVHYQVPFTLKTSGRTRLPQLKLQYLDAGTQRIASLYHPGINLFALATWIQLGALALLLVLITIIVLRLYPVVRVILHRYRVLRKIRQQLRETTQAQDIRDLLREIAALYHWNPNATLEEWLRQWNRVSRGRAPLDMAIGKLSAMLYGNQKEDVREIRAGLMKSLYKAPLISR